MIVIDLHYGLTSHSSTVSLNWDSFCVRTGFHLGLMLYCTRLSVVIICKLRYTTNMSKEDLKQKIKEAVEKDPLRVNIQKVSLFGSFVRGDFKDDSDVDVLIEFTPTASIGFFELARIKRNMESFTNREVDLLTPEAISKYFRVEVLKEAEKIYEK